VGVFFLNTAYLLAVIVHFVERVDQSLNALGPNPQFAIDENGFVHATSLVYDGVRNIRHAVLQNRVCLCCCRTSHTFTLPLLPLSGDAIVQWLACSTSGREVADSSPALAAGSRVATVGQLLFAPWALAYSTLHPFVVGK